MNNENITPIIPILVLFFLLYTLLILILGGFIQENTMQKQAIKNNCAHWATDTNGEAIFTWGK